jgi:hypothetical protein
MKPTIQSVLIILLLCACSSPPMQSTAAPQKTLTSTRVITPTLHEPGTQTPSAFPKIAQTAQPPQLPAPLPSATEPATATNISSLESAVTVTQSVRSSAEITIADYGIICGANAEPQTAEISPDGQWIAMPCKSNTDEADSYLRVVRIQGVQVWSIHYADYAKGTLYDRNNQIFPLHWSKDGKYLFARSPSRFDGCCWIYGDLFLVRLNLENGQQTEIANYVAKGVASVDFSISPSDRYVSIIPSLAENNLYILDLSTWKQRVIKIKYKNTGAGHALISNNDEKIILMLREYPEVQNSDRTYGSLVLVDLKNGSQKKLVSGAYFEDTPVPVSWQDDNHVLLTTDREYLLLNIATGEITKAENPKS